MVSKSYRDFDYDAIGQESEVVKPEGPADPAAPVDSEDPPDLAPLPYLLGRRGPAPPYPDSSGEEDLKRPGARGPREFPLRLDEDDAGEVVVLVKPIEVKGVEVAAEFESTRDAIAFLYKYVGIMTALCPVDASCIVLDVDGTVLLNLKEGTFAVRAFRDFSLACARKGVDLFIVTARPDSNEGRNRKWTEDQLKECGLPQAKRIFMRPEGDDYAEYKFRAREEIRRTHRILVSCGDQFPDFTTAPPNEVSDTAVVVGFMGDRNGALCLKLPAEN